VPFAIPVEVYIAAPYVIAVLVAVSLPFLGLLQYRLAGNVAPETRLIAIFALVGIGALMTVALTDRTLNEAQLATAVRPALEDFEEGFAASRWITLLLLGAAFVEIVRGWMHSRSQPGDDPAKPVLVALLLYYIGTILIQATGSEQTGFSHRTLYVPLLMVAMYSLRVENLARVVEGAKWVVLGLGLSSLVVALLRPDFVLHRPAPGLIPGVDWRLFGLTSHANTLGPIALLGLVLELHTPSSRRAVRALHLIVAFTVFALAQSKTAWGAAIAIVVAVVVPLALLPRSGPGGSGADFRRAAWTVLACVVAAIALAATFAALDASDAPSRAVGIETLTGRTQIWNITLNAWRDNVLFGYGPEIWGFRRRIQFNMYHVGQAHNQIVQTLGEAGLAGLALLLVFTATLMAVALRRFVQSRGVILAVLLLVLARWVTEAPMRAEGVLSWTTFMQALLIVFVCHFMRRPAPKSARGFVDTVPATVRPPGRLRRAEWA